MRLMFLAWSLYGGRAQGCVLGRLAVMERQPPKLLNHDSRRLDTAEGEGEGIELCFRGSATGCTR